MKNNIIISIFIAGLVFGISSSFAQEIPTLTAVLDSGTPQAKTLVTGMQNTDVTKIRLTSSGTVSLNGVYLGTDVSGGLSNFTNLFVYDVTEPDEVYLGAYSSQNSTINLVSFDQIVITPSSPKIFMIRASLSDTAAGTVRIGFSGFTFSTATAPNLSGVPIYGNVMTLPGVLPTPTPTPILVCEHAAPPSGCFWQGPDIYPNCSAVLVCQPVTPASLGFTSLLALNLTEGDTISAAGSSDPDIYIANVWGYKRLFLNPVIFGFYGHLGGFANVKNITTATRNMMVTTGLVRNCETNDPKVYGIEVTGEDAGTLHWVNTTGQQAIVDDPEFFKKVFCINNNEFNWYAKGSDYTSVNQVPSYSR